MYWTPWLHVLQCAFQTATSCFLFLQWCAYIPLRRCELLVGRPLTDVWVNHFSYPTHTRSRWCLLVPVPDPHQRFLSKITLGCVTPTIPHLVKTIGLLYIYLADLMVIVQVSYEYGYTCGSGPGDPTRPRRPDPPV